MIKVTSPINYNYATIKITQSRLDKGLIAIPMSLARWFPEQNARIQIFLDDAIAPEIKQYSSYKSRTRECRIGGMAEWFRNKKIKDGDEIVIQLIDKERFVYRLIPESRFILKTHEIQNNLDSSESEISAKEEIEKLSRWAGIVQGKVVLNEYIRLINTIPIKERRYVSRHSQQTKESTPYNLRVLLGDIYQGHCQVCDFWFLKKDSEPYFEIHHINPLLSNNPKNLLVVCANCHNQIILTAKREEFIKQLHI
jgi:hypothetical protein